MLTSSVPSACHSLEPASRTVFRCRPSTGCTAQTCRPAEPVPTDVEATAAHLLRRASGSDNRRRSRLHSRFVPARAGARSAGLSGSPTSVGSVPRTPVNELGNWLGDIALAVVVFDRTGSALATAGVVPGGALRAGAGRAGRGDLAGAAPAERARGRLRGRGGCVRLPCAGCAHGAPLGVLLALAGVDGALALAARSLVRARTAALFPDGVRLRRANAALNLGMTSAAAAGPAVAGLLVATAGAPTALWLDAASFAAGGAPAARARRVRAA